jgi:hypothetical protein
MTSINGDIIRKFGSYQLLRTYIHEKGFLGIGKVKRAVIVLQKQQTGQPTFERVTGFKVRLAQNRNFFERLFKKTTTFQLTSKRQIEETPTVELKQNFKVISSSLNSSLAQIRALALKNLKLQGDSQINHALNEILPSSSKSGNTVLETVLTPNLETVLTPNGEIVENYFALLHQATVIKEEGEKLNEIKGQISQCSQRAKVPLLIYNKKNGRHNEGETIAGKKENAQNLKDLRAKLETEFGISTGIVTNKKKAHTVYQYNETNLEGFNKSRFNSAQFIANNVATLKGLQDKIKFSWEPKILKS